jgi:hypothetical protein
VTGPLRQQQEEEEEQQQQQQQQRGRSTSSIGRHGQHPLTVAAAAAPRTDKTMEQQQQRGAARCLSQRTAGELARNDRETGSPVSCAIKTGKTGCAHDRRQSSEGWRSHERARRTGAYWPLARSGMEHQRGIRQRHAARLKNPWAPATAWEGTFLVAGAGACLGGAVAVA